MNSPCYTFKTFFNHGHHPDIILVRHINFHGGKFRVVGTIHSFIAEHFTKFINSVKSCNYQTLKVKFVCNAQIKRHIQCIMMRFKWTCRRTAMNRLQDWRFNFHPALIIEIIPHGADYL